VMEIHSRKSQVRAEVNIGEVRRGEDITGKRVLCSTPLSLPPPSPSSQF
jgi:hypothetical protein